MIFMGYHGTSEASAQNILASGVKADRLPRTGQIGRGFYIAKTNGLLPAWASTNAVAGARNSLPAWKKMICYLTGYYNFPFIDDSAKVAILKIYSLFPLAYPKWSIMNPPDLQVVRVTGGLDESQIEDGVQWLQMVIPTEDFTLLRVTRDDGVPEEPGNWLSKESPF